MDGDGGIRRARTRVLVAGIAASVAALFVSESALAQLPLGSDPAGEAPTSGIVGTVTQVLPTNQVVEQVAPVVQEAVEPVAAVTQPVAQATAPAAQAAASVTAPPAEVTAPIAQTAAPVAHAVAPVVGQGTGPVGETTRPLLQQTAQALESVQPLVDAAAPLLEATGPLTEPLLAPVVESTSPLLEATAPVLETTDALLGSTARVLRQDGSASSIATTLHPDDETVARPSAHGVAIQTPPSVASNDPATPTSPAAGILVGLSSEDRTGFGSAVRSQRPRLVGQGLGDGWATTRTSPRDHRVTHIATKLGAPRMPAPSEPTGPLGFLAAISAAFGSSGALVFLAALAAFILVVAPGLGRRLRPAMAPWPLPIPLASLERPG